ncbi:MAG TPA: hypothetical protein VGM29_07140 [Polyangiaceae bacterium]|jgi:hypothetical protein
MPAAKGWSVALGLFVLGATAPACVQPSVRPIIGPDGSAMLHVHCGRDQFACFELAGQSCPHGYDMSPIFDVSEGNFLVRCRAQAAARVATTSNAESNTWHPNGDAVPWRPPPGASKPVKVGDLPPTRRTAAGEVDVGY